ncbi:MAG: outer membrane protein assembly factor BamD [Calditrichaeota bacterium]|nr:MAG: outer membrane protein assembly factor BamD [Calditrichota bacterium]
MNRIILEHETLLNKYPDSEFAPTLLFQLAELHYEQSQLVYQAEMSRYEEQVADAGDMNPPLPIIDMTKTIAYCRLLLEKYPHINYRDRVLYKIATASLESGQMESAKSWFETLIWEFPNSSMALESHFRIGEYYFEQRQFAEAIQHYRFLLNHWDNPYFALSLYKLGWSYYNQQNYSDAISTFLVLLEDINLVAGLDQTTHSVAKTDLQTESIHYIADSFTEFGSPSNCRSFFLSLVDKTYTSPILLKIAELYEARSLNLQAIDIYRILLEFYPFSTNAPQLYTNIIQNYEVLEKMEDSNQVREELVHFFHPDGDWEKHQSDSSVQQNGLSLMRESLIFLGVYYQAKAQQTDSLFYYQRAINKYLDFLKNPVQENSHEINYYLAECYYEMGDFINAADTYQQVVSTYLTSPYREKAAFNRIFCFVKAKEMNIGIDSSGLIVIPHFITAHDTLTISLATLIDGYILQACNDFYLTFPESAFLGQVLMKMGETLYNLRLFSSAVTVYQQVYQLPSAVPFKDAAAINVGQALYDSGEYQQACDWLTMFLSDMPQSAEASQAWLLLSSAQFKIAETLSLKGENIGAAFTLLTIAGTSPDSTVQAKSMFEAALQYQKSDSLLLAAQTFERLARRYLKFELGDDALYQAAGLRERLADWSLAAADYLQIADQYPESEFHLRALKNAVYCYESGQEWIAAKNVCKRLIDSFPKAIEEVIEFSCRRGEMAMNAGQTEEARSYYQNTVNRYLDLMREGNAPDSYYVANAQFMLGEIMMFTFKSIQLTPPFESNLKRKMNAFADVIKQYTESTKYQIADWTTASMFRIGESFEELVRSLLTAPIPENLTLEQQQLYRQKLAERARPFQEKALETFRKNVEQATASQIENQWIEKSRDRIQGLQNELQREAAETAKNQGE